MSATKKWVGSQESWSHDSFLLVGEGVRPHPRSFPQVSVTSHSWIPPGKPGSLLGFTYKAWLRVYWQEYADSKAATLQMRSQSWTFFLNLPQTVYYSLSQETQRPSAIRADDWLESRWIFSRGSHDSPIPSFYERQSAVYRQAQTNVKLAVCTK